MPAHLHGRPIDRDDHIAVERAAAAVVDAGLILGGRDLALHDCERPGKGQLHKRRFSGLARTGEVAGYAVSEMAGFQFHDRLFGKDAIARGEIGHDRRDRQRAGKSGSASEQELEFEGNQHGCPAFPGGKGPALRRPLFRRQLVTAGISAGAFTWVIRSSFHLPSTLKCAVAPRSAASIRLCVT